ncbi:cell division control protein 6 homolog [Triticum aestivum]|uniref:cell division control protein 6 homolog n=1 Tax=Triticum aestivum TaxID=4565 RepID=UPI001D001F65|nr:cell division control protein 6 homolog [Triticum aestivum]
MLNRISLTRLIIADEMDYLITRDRAVLHDVFMLTNHQFSRCILIGIVNAIDPTDRFLPKLQSLNSGLISENTTVLYYLQVTDNMYILIFFYTPVP